jgi:hypothetical protein
MQLVYASQGRESPPWQVDSLDLGARYGARAHCSTVRFGARDIRRTCVGNDTLFAWNDSAQVLTPVRPVGARMSMRVRGARGNTLIYETSDTATVAVSDLRIPIVHTTVTTVDSTGKVVRRLRERFALSLATAIDGVFEVPSESSAAGWRVEQEFALVRIVGPPR